MKHFNFTWLPATLLLMLPLNAADYLPLDPGNAWTYRSNNSQETLQITVGVQPLALRDGNTYYKLTGWATRPLWVRDGGNGILYWLNEELLREEILIEFQPFSGGYWTTPISAPCDQGGQTQDKLVGFEAGGHIYREAREIRYMIYGCADTGVDRELYVDNIGLVRRTVNTIAGPRTFDLISAKVSPLSFYGRPNVSFRVSVPSPTIVKRSPGDLVNTEVILALQADRANPVRLRYNSSQRYDVRIRDAQGNVVYVWSSTMIFLPTTSQETAYSRNYTVPISLPLPDGDYLIEAWLTTDQPEREFAGAVNVTVLGDIQPAAARASRPTNR